MVRTLKIANFICVIFVFISYLLWIEDTSNEYDGNQKYRIFLSNSHVMHSIEQSNKKILEQYNHPFARYDKKYAQNSNYYQNETYFRYISPNNGISSVLFVEPNDSLSTIIRFYSIEYYDKNHIETRRSLFGYNMPISDILKYEKMFESEVLAPMGKYDKLVFKGIVTWYTRWFFCNQKYILSCVLAFILMNLSFRTIYKRRQNSVNQ